MPELRTSSHTDSTTAHTVIAVDGELDIATVEGFRTDVAQAVAAAETGDRVILDFHSLSFIDSSGLQALIQCLKLCERHGKLLVLASPAPRVVQILRVSALDQRFPAFPTVAQALEAPASDLVRRSSAPRSAQQ